MDTSKSVCIIVRSQSVSMPPAVRLHLEERFAGKAQFFNSTKQYQFLIKFNPGVYKEEIDAIRELDVIVDSITQREPILYQVEHLQQLRYDIEGVYFLEIDSSFKPNEWPTFTQLK